jgi:hypothetical protein
MKQTNEKVYRCDHCNKAMVSKGFMVYHEKWCKKNPNNMHKCFEWCTHLRMETEKEEHETEDGTYFVPLEKSFYCEKLEMSLYSYKLEKKLCNRKDEFNKRIEGLQRMPLQCESFKDRCDESDYYAEDKY